MPLSQLPLDCDNHVIADWFEFHILVSEYFNGRVRDIQRAWDKRKNSEDTSPDGLTSDEFNPDEMFLEQILQQFRFRMSLLGDDYPFEFNSTEETLSIKAQLSRGAVLYLFCLFLSNSNKSEIFELDLYQLNLDNRTRDLFQACSTWAAASVVSGNAVTFGVPRPDRSGFKAKLTQCYGLMKEGTVRDEPLPAAPLRTQDAGIDVIAWAVRPDEAAGRHYLLGQVASGNNWKDKSITEDISSFHRIWFSVIPPSTPTAAMFIPFCIDEVKNATHKECLDMHTITFGNMYYRYVIPTLAGKGLELAENHANLTIERTGDYSEIRSWVNQIISDLRAI